MEPARKRHAQAPLNIVVGLLLCVVITSVREVAGQTVARAVSLWDDTRWERGLIVWSPKPGRHVRQAELRPWADRETPVWGVAQWHSRFTLADAKPEKLTSGAVRFFDGAKAVVFGPADSEQADLILALDATQEYGPRSPESGDPWPHLLVERRLTEHPAMTELASVPFHIRYRLLKARADERPGWNDRRHTAQFVFYVTVQNLNRSSPGHGDYLWFGLLLYDRRHRFPPAYAAQDIGSSKKKGTGRFIFQPDFKRVSQRSPHDGEWVTIDADLLPTMREALDTAWQRGYLEDSKDPADYRLGSMNMGWEITGPIDAAVQVQGLRLDARMKQE